MNETMSEVSEATGVSQPESPHASLEPTSEASGGEVSVPSLESAVRPRRAAAARQRQMMQQLVADDVL